MAILTDTDITRLANKRDLVIWPFDELCVTGLGYDLQIGCIYPLSDNTPLSEIDGKYVIPPKAYCLIITREFVWLSGKLAGTLHARGTLAAKGLFTNSTNVDPNFKGQMIMSVVNLSSVHILLAKDDPFITLILHDVRTHTKLLVGREGTKNSTRVTEQMSSEIYATKAGPTDQHEAQREHVNQMHQFLNKSNHSHLAKFEALIREAESRTVFKVAREKMHSVIAHYGGSASRHVLGLVTLAGYAITIYIIVSVGYGYFMADQVTQTDWRILALLLVAVLQLINGMRSSK